MRRRADSSKGGHELGDLLDDASSKASFPPGQALAPGVTLLNAKVCPSTFCDESASLAGMQWAAERGARVANLSLG